MTSSYRGGRKKARQYRNRTKRAAERKARLDRIYDGPKVQAIVAKLRQELAKAFCVPQALLFPE